MEKVDYLIDYLLKENPDMDVNRNVTSLQDKFNLYRSLCNVRNAKPIGEDYLREESIYLNEINHNKGIVSSESIDTLDKAFPGNALRNDDKMSLWQGDITSLEVGAIVNAANSQGLGCFIPCHNCIDNQINTYAGIALRLECDEYMKTIDYHLPTGEAFITKAYNLPAQHVIHTVGPIIQDTVSDSHRNLLSKCYDNCLRLAQENNIRTIAFCSISTGVFRFPKDLACQIALDTVDNYLDESRDVFDKVIFNVYSNGARDIYEKFIG